MGDKIVMGDRALVVTLIVVALLVTVTWLIVAITNPDRAAGVTVVLTTVIGSLVGLVGKVRASVTDRSPDPHDPTITDPDPKRP